MAIPAGRCEPSRDCHAALAMTGPGARSGKVGTREDGPAPNLPMLRLKSDGVQISFIRRTIGRYIHPASDMTSRTAAPLVIATDQP